MAAVEDTADAERRHARYHELDTNAPRLVAKIREVKRHLDPETTRQSLQRLENDRAFAGAMRMEALANKIERLKRLLAADLPYRQLEHMLAELESQRSLETSELASFHGTLALGRAQILPPDILAEIFLQCNVPSLQLVSGGPLYLEMQTNLNILRVCSTWRAVALSTPALWCELRCELAGRLPLDVYHSWLRRAASVPLNLNFWPRGGWGDERYWADAAEILHTHCRALGTLHLKLPGANTHPPAPTLFPPPHRPTNLRNLTIHSYDDCIHNTLSNIPWSRLLRLVLRDEYEGRFISPTQLASILSQTVHLTQLVANLGPDRTFGPSPARLVHLLELHTLEISWIDPEGNFGGIIPHSFIDLFDKLHAPALRFLTITTSKDADAFVLPALTSFAAHSKCSLESLHVSMGAFRSPVSSSMDTLATLLRDLPTLTSLHWRGADLPGLTEALICATGDDRALLPKLVDISLVLNSYDGLLPGFVEMIRSRRVSLNSQPPTVAVLRQFHLQGANLYVEDFDDYADNDEYVEKPPPSLSSSSNTANEDALTRLEELLVNADPQCSLRGLVDFQHFDQKLTLLARDIVVRQKHRQLAHVDGEIFLHCDDELVWHWMDSRTRFEREQRYI
ncbi:hypothetical protein C8R45DRAFT_1165906 [Mycena sanguinolenta]|nr:hypothetical protein C8R45DRAFT_1165906 [Mycena sanguinolenta]